MINIIIKNKPIFLHIMLFCGFLSTTTTEVFGMMEPTLPYFQNEKQKKQSVEFFIKQQTPGNDAIIKTINPHGSLEDANLQIPNITTFSKITIQETANNNPFSFSVLYNNTIPGIIQPTQKQFDKVLFYLLNNDPVYVHILNTTSILEVQNTNKNILSKLLSEKIDHKQSSSFLRNDDTTVNNDGDPTFTNSGFLYGTPENSSGTEAQADNNDDFFDNTKSNDALQLTEDQIIQTIINTMSELEKMDHDFVVAAYIEFKEKPNFRCIYFSTYLEGAIQQKFSEEDIPNINSLSIIYTDQFNRGKDRFEEDIRSNRKVIISFQKKETITYYHVKIRENLNANKNTPIKTNDVDVLAIQSDADLMATVINNINNFANPADLVDTKIYTQDKNPSNKYISHTSKDDILDNKNINLDTMHVIYSNQFAKSLQAFFESLIDKGKSIILSHKTDKMENLTYYKVEKHPKDNIPTIIDWLADSSNQFIVGIDIYKKSENFVDTFELTSTKSHPTVLSRIYAESLPTFMPTIYTDQLDKKNKKDFEQLIQENGALIISFSPHKNKKSQTLYEVKTRKETQEPTKTTDSKNFSNNVNPTPTNDRPIYISGYSAAIIAAFAIALAYKYDYVPDALSYYITNIRNCVSNTITNRLSLSLFKK